MDAALDPPVRFQPVASISISAKTAQKNVQNFLEDYQSRSTASKGGDGTVTVQLQKLSTALHEEREMKKVSIWYIIFRNLRQSHSNFQTDVD